MSSQAVARSDVPVLPMQEPVVSLENVSLRFRLPEQRVSSIKEHMIRWLQGRIRFREFWALREITLTVGRGEVFALVGHNGSGKTTMLRLISRVLRPTSGRVVVRGRIAPLLEVGAGFHPELTGRENIFLNGALLGFSHDEMTAKLQRIVDFAEIDEFVDCPLRTYSSGMRARLGFAIATDFQPDLLIVDEVLSVGDQRFREKSKERIQKIQKGGATTLLVTHDSTVIESMCQRAALLDHGRLVMVGTPAEVLRVYLDNGSDKTHV